MPEDSSSRATTSSSDFQGNLSPKPQRFASSVYTSRIDLHSWYCGRRGLLSMRYGRRWQTLSL